MFVAITPYHYQLSIMEREKKHSYNPSYVYRLSLTVDSCDFSQQSIPTLILC
jgi:hypothetical protein